MISIALTLCLAVSLAIPASAAFISESPESTFHINVVDENGNPIDSVSVSLYSYLDKEVVLNDTTNSSGSSTLHYTPDIDPENLDQYSIDLGSTKDTFYADYMIYVSKPGYQEQTYNLTKLFSPSGKNDYDFENQENITITMPESSNNIAYQQSSEQNSTYQYLISTGKLSAQNPVYVLQPEDKIEMEKQGITSSSPQRLVSKVEYPNIQVPIGEFHVVNGGSVQVTFSTSDSLKVQTKVNSGSGWGASGSVSRTFAQTASFSALTTSTSYGIKQVYYVMGDFVQEETYTASGSSRYTLKLVKLNAATGRRTATKCTTCMKAYSSVGNSDGTLRPLSAPQDFIALYRSKTVDLGLSASVKSVSLGVTRTTSTSTNIVYKNISTSASPKKLMLYDAKTGERIYHMTHN